MPRFSLTISDLDDAELATVVAALGIDVETTDTPDEDPTPTTEDPPKKRRGRKAKAAKPATLPANTTSPAPTPATKVEAPAPEPPPAPAPASGITLDSLVTKARAVGTGPLGQSGLLYVLNAMGASALPKVPDAHYPAMDALLDAVLAYAETPAPTKEWLKAVCQTGQYEQATASIVEAVNAATGL